MDDLVETFELADVSDVPNNPRRPHPAYAKFKVPDFSDQKKRREHHLELQRQRRQDLFSTARGLGTKLCKDEAVKELKKKAEDAERAVKEMEAIETPPARQEEKHYQYKNQIMMSEWLVDIPPPEELASKWYMVPCPQGRRTLLVATRGKTQAFSKSGHPTATFQSLLPGGSSEGPRKLSTVLDCLWNYENSCYFILDVLAWSNQPLLDCDAEFRFYWLKSKFADNPQFMETSPNHRYKFNLLPYYECTRDNMVRVMNSVPMFDGGSPNLDGLLFYHREGQYVHGYSPLVGWLKPYMLPDLLDVPVAQTYADMRPAGYENLEKHIEKTNELTAARAAAGRGRGRGRWRGRGRRGGRSTDTEMLDAGSANGPDGPQMDCSGNENSHPLM